MTSPAASTRTPTTTPRGSGGKDARDSLKKRWRRDMTRDDALRAALLKYRVLFFRDQQHLTDQEHEDFAALLGDPVAHPTVPGNGVCSSYDDDARALADTLTGSPEWVPVQFRYCDDIQASLYTQPWCNRFDEGE